MVTGQKYDPCIIDVFISAVRYMDGGPARKWWEFTNERKKKMANPKNTLAYYVTGRNLQDRSNDIQYLLLVSEGLISHGVVPKDNLRVYGFSIYC